MPIFASMGVVPKILEDAVEAFGQLPGVGRKTAFRYALHFLRSDKDELVRFGETFLEMARSVRHCPTCYNICDDAECAICRNASRDRSIICVVEDIRDIISIEATEQYRGLYHVLGGIISPMEGVGPSDLNIQPLVERVSAGGVKEVIVALSATMEGDTTSFYLFRQLRTLDVAMTMLARGISVGGALEYADELTLGRSIANRVPYESSLAR